MSRHVVVSLHGMFEGPVVVPGGRNNLVEGRLHVPSNVRIGVFVDGQGRRRVLDKEVAHANLDLRDILLNGLADLAGNEMTTSGGGCNGKFVLEPLHGHGALFLLRGRLADSGRRVGWLGQRTGDGWQNKAGYHGKRRDKQSNRIDQRKDVAKEQFHGSLRFLEDNGRQTRRCTFYETTRALANSLAKKDLSVLDRYYRTEQVENLRTFNFSRCCAHFIFSVLTFYTQFVDVHTRLKRLVIECGQRIDPTLSRDEDKNHHTN